MKKELLKGYINRLSKQDIINYLSHECVTASDEEIDMIYNAIKNDYEEILNTNFMSYISNYKLNFNPELYKKIIEKYNENKLLFYYYILNDSLTIFIFILFVYKINKFFFSYTFNFHFIWCISIALISINIWCF